jgi:hypothetical protein
MDVVGVVRPHRPRNRPIPTNAEPIRRRHHSTSHCLRRAAGRCVAKRAMERVGSSVPAPKMGARSSTEAAERSAPAAASTSATAAVNTIVAAVNTIVEAVNTRATEARPLAGAIQRADSIRNTAASAEPPIRHPNCSVSSVVAILRATERDQPGPSTSAIQERRAAPIRWRAVRPAAHATALTARR